MVCECSGGRAVRREGEARAADAIHLVEDLRRRPPPLRWRRRRPHDPEKARRNRLAAPPQPHGALLGGAPDGAAQFPLHISERTPLRTAVALERAARAAARPGGCEGTGPQGLPRSHLLA